ncbi:MAG: hypothetical protein WCT04_26825 [Planctomycetota bacterium]
MDSKPKVYLAGDSSSSQPFGLVLLLFVLVGIVASIMYFRASGRPGEERTGEAQVSSAAPVANTPTPVSAPVVQAVVVPKVEPSRIILAANFDTGADGFVFVRDAFRKTAKPVYADGKYNKKGGVSGGALGVHLGGRDSSSVLGMSGGWRKTFTLTAPEHLVLTFAIKVTQSSEYEEDEFSEALVMVDDALMGSDGHDYLAQVRGDGNGGPEVSSGWKTVSFALGEMSAGTHTVTLGAYNNKKTATNEFTDAWIDDVTLQTGSTALKQTPVLLGTERKAVEFQRLEINQDF